MERLEARSYSALLSRSSIPTAAPTTYRNAGFAGPLSHAFRVMMTEDAKFALGF
jgi:hypothetical protein